MANPNNPHGLQSLGTNIQGAGLVVMEYTKASGDATAIFRNDVVSRLSGGALSAGSFTPGTTLISGVALDYGAASTATTHKVIVDPGALYESQAAGSLAATDMGKNANVTLTQAGSTTTKLSGTQIDDSTKAATSTLDLHLLQLYNDGQQAYGANARIELVINKYRMNGGVAGV